MNSVYVLLVRMMTTKKGPKSWERLQMVNTSWRPFFLVQNSETLWDTNTVHLKSRFGSSSFLSEGSSNDIHVLRGLAKNLSPSTWLYNHVPLDNRWWVAAVHYCHRETRAERQMSAFHGTLRRWQLILLCMNMYDEYVQGSFTSQFVIL